MSIHEDEVHTDRALVRRLLANRFPQWAGLPIERVRSAGTDNAIYRLGDEMAVRLPRIHWAVEQVDKEQRWLPKLAPHLPLAIPVPIAMGRPAEGYPWNWSVYPWLEGENATDETMADPSAVATALASFVVALRGIDAADGPAPGSHNFFRGVPLSARDPHTRDAIEKLRGILDTDAATASWQAAVRAPVWDRPPVWIHGDLQSGNLLVTQGQLTGVIDFGGLAVGDPACDLIVAWNLFDAETRAVLREALTVDDATWARGRGWALSVSLVALPYYLETNPEIVRNSLHTIAQVFAEEGR